MGYIYFELKHKNILQLSKIKNQKTLNNLNKSNKTKYTFKVKNNNSSSLFTVNQCQPGAATVYGETTEGGEKRKNPQYCSTFQSLESTATITRTVPKTM